MTNDKPLKPEDFRPTMGVREDTVARHEDLLVALHRRASTQGGRPPSPEGAFADALFIHPLLVVADANQLRNDILYSCRTGLRTVLVNAANHGWIRLFCAEHVVAEVEKHAREWTTGSPVDQQAFMQLWIAEYLPLLRVVRGADHLCGILSPDELSRVATLERADRDDVPSAILAILLSAYFLSEDAAALAAVYGDQVDLEGHHQWLSVLKTGGDAGQLGEMLQGFSMVGGGIGAAAVGGGKRLVNRFGYWSLVAAGLIALGMVLLPTPETRKKILGGLGIFAAEVGALGASYQRMLASFRGAQAPSVEWAELRSVLSAEALLTRACLQNLAAAPRSNCSAAEVARDLSDLAVAQSETKVRSVLQAQPAFFEVWRGRWQLGEPRPLAPKESEA